MGANKVFLIKLFNNFMERILIAIRIGGGGGGGGLSPPLQKVEGS